MEHIDAVRDFYDASVEMEWARMERHPVEYAVTRHYLDRYIQPGARVLDIGGGPGRYSLYLAQRGCDVTLLDLSPANVAFAREKARSAHLPLTALAGDAREAEALVVGPFDHVLLMGPLYHLQTEENRRRAVLAARNLLAPGGTLFASIITSHAGVLYYLQNDPALILAPEEEPFLENIERGRSTAGRGFTEAYFMQVDELVPFMESCGLTTLHRLSCEGFCSPREADIAADPAVFERWIKLSLAACERPEFMGLAEHLLYVGRK